MDGDVLVVLFKHVIATDMLNGYETPMNYGCEYRDTYMYNILYTIISLFILFSFSVTYTGECLTIALLDSFDSRPVIPLESIHVRSAHKLARRFLA